MNEEEFQKTAISRLRALEQHIVNLIFPIQEISKVLTRPEKINELLKLLSKPLIIDDTNFKIVLKQLLEAKTKFSEDLRSVDLQKTLSEIKYIGMRLKSIEEDISKLKNEGLTRKVKLDFTCDGYELVKKRKIYEEKKEIPEIFDDPNEILTEVLSSLTEIESKVLIHRYGLFGQEKKTFQSIGNLIGYKSRERASAITAKALRKLRHASRINKIKKLPESALRKDVTGD